MNDFNLIFPPTHHFILWTCYKGRRPGDLYRGYTTAGKRRMTKGEKYKEISSLLGFCSSLVLEAKLISYLFLGGAGMECAFTFNTRQTDSLVLARFQKTNNESFITSLSHKTQLYSPLPHKVSLSHFTTTPRSSRWVRLNKCEQELMRRKCKRLKRKAHLLLLWLPCPDFMAF